MLVAQITLGLMALGCAGTALTMLLRSGDDQRVAIVSLLVLAVFFVALMVWAQFIPVESTVL
jgi:hypothetical protein